MSQGSPSPIGSSDSPSSDEARQARVLKRLGRKTAKMLCNRELYGNVITSAKGRYNFREEYTKRQVSEPTVWAYSWTKGDGSYALEQLVIDSETDLVISGDRAGGDLRFGLVVKDTKEDHYGYRCRPECTCAFDSGEIKRSPESPGELWPLNRISFDGISSISCMKKFGNPGLHKILYPSAFADVCTFTIGKCDFACQPSEKPGQHVSQFLKLFCLRKQKYSI